MTSHQRARAIVDMHFPNYARQCVPTSVTDLEHAIAADVEAMERKAYDEGFSDSEQAHKAALAALSAKPVGEERP